MENNIEQRIADWKASIRVESNFWDDIIDASTEDYMESNKVLWGIIVEGRDIINQLKLDYDNLWENLDAIEGERNNYLEVVIPSLKKQIGEIETQEYGWKFDELKSDYNSVLEQLEEANEELAFYKMREINLLTEIQNIENGY